MTTKTKRGRTIAGQDYSSITDSCHLPIAAPMICERLSADRSETSQFNNVGLITVPWIHHGTSTYHDSMMDP